MGMPKKGTRQIVVEGRAYRWSAGERRRSAGLTDVCVEQEGTHGQRLMSVFACTWSDGYDPRLAGLDVVTPDAVRRLILAGLANGWRPDQHGLAPLRLDSARIHEGRPIEVEGRAYRWSVSEDLGDGGLGVSVEQEGARGQRLLGALEINSTGAGSPAGASLALVTPAMVRGLILAGLASGWRPEKRGLTPFQLDGAEGRPQRLGPVPSGEIP